MKKLIYVFALFLVQTIATTAQINLPSDSWSLGFGLSYPRFVNLNLPSTAGSTNFGGYIGVQRNFSEHVAFRMQLSFSSLEAMLDNGPGYGSTIKSNRNNAFAADIDILYYLAPCEKASPYFTFGVGPVFYFLDDDRPNKLISSSNFTYQVNGGLGLDLALTNDWKLKSEMSYHTVMDAKFDGRDGSTNGGLLGGFYASYLALKIGLYYYFDKGEPSKLCQLYSGLSVEQKDYTDYNKIESMIKAHIPKEITKEVVVEKPVKESNSMENWVLVGVNFASNSSKLTADSYPILYDAAKTLLKNTDVNITIEGYTDNVGSESYNQKLSAKRAEVVKSYLVSKGVVASRLTVLGNGESNPIADNGTAEGRAMNRRIEFKTK